VAIYGPVIDLRSDTLTQPTGGMRKAIAEAVVGDEQKREDPTVIALEERVAALLGHEEAVFVPTATMANEIALLLHATPGDEVLAESRSHIFLYELGGPAVHSGLVMKGISSPDGRFTADDVRALANPRQDVHVPRTRIVSLENTHNGGGGRVWPLGHLREVTSAARELGLKTHLDGARLMNAAVAAGIPASEYAREFDTVTLCLSKGLGCPLGALVAGSATDMHQARRFKHLFGGAMRQAGIVAAAGMYALDHHVDRLAEDHANARRLAEGLADAGLPVDPAQVESNFVLLDVGSLGLTADEAVARLKAEDVLLSFASDRDVLRAVTHYGVTSEEVERALVAIPRALGALVSA
jgi:threonine aldolase